LHEERGKEKGGKERHLPEERFIGQRQKINYRSWGTMRDLPRFFFSHTNNQKEAIIEIQKPITPQEFYSSDFIALNFRSTFLTNFLASFKKF